MATGRKRLTEMPTGASPRTRSSGNGTSGRRSIRKSSLLSTFGSSRNSVTKKSPLNGRKSSVGKKASPAVGNAKSFIGRRKDSPVPFSGNKMRQTLIGHNFKIHSPAEILNLLETESATIENVPDKKVNASTSRASAVEIKPKRKSSVVGRGNQYTIESSFTKIKPKTTKRISQAVATSSPAKVAKIDTSQLSFRETTSRVAANPKSPEVEQNTAKTTVTVVPKTNNSVTNLKSTIGDQNTSATNKNTKKFYGASRSELAEARKSMSKHPATKKLWNHCDQTVALLRRSQMSVSPQVKVLNKRQSRKVKKNDTVFDFTETSPKENAKKKVKGKKRERTVSQPIWTAVSSTKKLSRHTAPSFWSGQKVGKPVDSRKSVMNIRIMKPKPPAVVVQKPPPQEESINPDDTSPLDNVSVELPGCSFRSPPHHIFSPPHIPDTNFTPAQFRIKPCAQDASTPLNNQNQPVINIQTLTVDNAFGFEEDSEAELSPVRLLAHNESTHSKSCSYTAADISNPWRFTSQHRHSRYDAAHKIQSNSSLMSCSLKVGARRDSFSKVRKPAKSFTTTSKPTSFTTTKPTSKTTTTKPQRQPLATINHQNYSHKEPVTKPSKPLEGLLKPEHNSRNTSKPEHSSRNTSKPEQSSRNYSLQENRTEVKKRKKTRDASPSVFQRRKIAASGEKKEMQKSFDCMNAHFDDVMGFELVCE